MWMCFHWNRLVWELNRNLGVENNRMSSGRGRICIETGFVEGWVSGWDSGNVDWTQSGMTPEFITDWFSIGNTANQFRTKRNPPIIKKNPKFIPLRWSYTWKSLNFEHSPGANPSWIFESSKKNANGVLSGILKLF